MNTTAYKRHPEHLHNLLAQGLTNQEIAEKLGISRSTVKSIIDDIERETGIHNRILLAFYALGKGIVTQNEIKAAISRERRSA